jgi:SAM-dependent methyltransferase
MALDLLELYRWAVQDPETHVAVLARMYAALRPGRRPTVLREDFAGTSAEAVAWVAAGEDRQALAIDLDAPTLAWAERRAARLLGARAAEVRFLVDDVRAVAPPRVAAADIISALNFSVLYFHQRAELIDYFRHALGALAPDGMLVMNLFGGPGAMRASIDRRQVTPRPRHPRENAPAPFEYQWEQLRFDAVTARLDCAIHFEVPAAAPGASPLVARDAFRYAWRLWTLPELTLAMREAGFAATQVWRHTYDPSHQRQPVFLGAVDRIEGLDTWTAYVIGLR